MSRWAVPSMLWSCLANHSARDRVSGRISSTRPFRSSFETSTPASHRLRSRVSIYDECPVYSRPLGSTYNSFGDLGGYTSSFQPYKPFRSSHHAAPTPDYLGPYYQPARDAFDYERSRRRYSSSGSNSRSRPSSRRNSVRWDDDTFQGRQRDWDSHYDRYGGESDYDYRQSHGRYGRPTSSIRGTSPRATAAGNAYLYTGAAAANARHRTYYADDAGRRFQKDYLYGSSRRSAAVY